MERRRVSQLSSWHQSSFFAEPSDQAGILRRAAHHLICTVPKSFGKRCKVGIAVAIILLLLLRLIFSTVLMDQTGSQNSQQDATQQLSASRASGLRVKFNVRAREDGRGAEISERSLKLPGSSGRMETEGGLKEGSGVVSLTEGDGFGSAAISGKGNIQKITTSSAAAAAEREQLAKAESIHDLLEQDRNKCPLHYDRLSYEDIKAGKEQSYLLGAAAKPTCNNCNRDTLWSHFCQFQTHGPVCPGWLKWQIASDWVQRAESGSPGVKEMMTMTPCDLFPFIRDRTLWLVGDSLTLEWSKAVQCFMFEFWEDLDIRHELLARHPNPPKDFQGWCARLAQGTKVCFLRANTGHQFVSSVLPSMPALGAEPSDIMVLNFAVWHNDHKEYADNIMQFAGFYAKHKAELPTAIWRDSPVQHFDTQSGDYVWPIPSTECKAIPAVQLQTDNSLKALEPTAQEMAEGGWRNKIALPVMTQLGIPVIHTWNQTLPMWQYHTHFNTKEGDCTHMCHPSEYQYWVFELFRTFRKVFPHLAGPTWSID